MQEVHLCDVLEEAKPILCDGDSLWCWGLIEKRHEETQGGDANILDLGLRGWYTFIKIH